MSSTRLPGKVLKLLARKPLIWHIYQRALQCKLVDKVIVATSLDKSDDLLADYCAENNLNVFRGSLNNVLSRFINILNIYPNKYYVRITGDCPLIFPRFIDEQIRILNDFNGDLIWSKDEVTVFEGQGVHSVKSLRYIAEKSNDPKDLEHVGNVYIANHPEQFKIVEVSFPGKYLQYKYRLTVDEEEDYQLMKIIYDNFKNSLPVDFMNAINWLIKNDDVVEINKTVRHKQLNIDLVDKRKQWASLNKAGFARLDL